jgi:ubiquitin C-terminal hydrolase
VNTGNTCYINAVVQCLSRVTPLTSYVLSPECRRDCNPRNPLGTGGAVLDAFCTLLRQMQAGRGTVSADGLQRAIARHKPQFAGYGQHDANDFCVTLLDAIHEDLNQSEVARGSRVRVDSLSGMVLHRTCNKSKIIDLFHGETVTEFRYKCGHNERMNEPLAFLALSLPQGRPTVSLEDCIRLWEQGQQLTGDNAMVCERCNRLQDLTRKCRVLRFAPVLVIQVKRFSQGYGGLTKNLTPLTYPLRFDVSPFAQQSAGDYELVGVIRHAGTLVSGHYTALVREAGGQWYDISDSSVCPAEADFGVSRPDATAMALFYQRAR